MQKVESEARVSRLEALTESFMREEKHEAVRAAEAAREKVARSEQLLSRKPRAGCCSSGAYEKDKKDVTVDALKPLQVTRLKNPHARARVIDPTRRD